MRSHSCGAILYTILNNKVYIILGKEYNEWFPFKGRCEKNETFEQAAIREIKEETCNLVKISNIHLDCVYDTPRKTYHIGIVFVPNTFMREFYIMRKRVDEKKYLEKSKVKMFMIDIIDHVELHPITETPIKYYMPFLKKLQKKISKMSFCSSRSEKIEAFKNWCAVRS